MIVQCIRQTCCQLKSNFTSLFVCMFLPLFTIGQTTYTGIVINKKDSSRVPYATVGLIKENIGINADENGNFILSSGKPQPNDSLVISCVGFVTQKISIANITVSNTRIELEEQVTAMKDLLLVARTEWSTATLNDFTDCGNAFLGSSGYLQQVAQHFVSAAENSRLIKLSICRSPVKPGKALFRIRIYAMDTITGGPGEDLCDKIIEVKTRHEMVKVNLEEYKIRIPGKDFFVAVEWLKIPFNEQETKRPDGKMVFAQTLYAPTIGWEDVTGANLQAWQLNYSREWRPLTDYQMNKKRVLISATIRY